MRLKPCTATYYQWYYLRIESWFVFKWPANSFAPEAQQLFKHCGLISCFHKTSQQKCFVLECKQQDGDKPTWPGQSHLYDWDTLAGWDWPLVLLYLLTCSAKSGQCQPGGNKEQYCPLRKIFSFLFAFVKKAVLRNNYLCSRSSSSSCLHLLVPSFLGLSDMRQPPLTLSTFSLYVPEERWVKVMGFIEHQKKLQTLSAGVRSDAFGLARVQCYNIDTNSSTID